MGWSRAGARASAGAALADLPPRARTRVQPAKQTHVGELSMMVDGVEGVFCYFCC